MTRNCILKHLTAGKRRKATKDEKRERRRKQLLNDLKEKRRCGNLKEKALDLTLWRTRF
jgi:hypothetical protein